MSTKLNPVGSSVSTSTPAEMDSSKWDSWSVKIFFGIGALAIATIALKLISDSAPSPSPEPKTKEDPELIKFISEQHKSGLLSKRQTVCVNEAKPLPFEQFAEGIIRFETDNLNLKDEEEFFIRCSDYKSHQKAEPFFMHMASPEGDLEFFIPNLPLMGRIKVEFGTSQEEVSLDLNVDQARGIYTIFKEKLSYHSRSEASPPPIIRNPFIVNNSSIFLAAVKPEPLDNPLSIRLSENNLPQITVPTEEEKGHLIIKNSGGKCVVYLQLMSGKHSIRADERDIVVPFVISAGKTKAVSKKMLEVLWKNSYRWATSKTSLVDDLDLRLVGIQQMLYRDPVPLKT